jgi:hypothetical protein
MVSHYDMVDSKICAVDATWSGAAITKRRRQRRESAANLAPGR